MEILKTILENQVLLTLFLTIAIGYLIGQINIKGFSLGSGAVLFVGLAIGAIAPQSAPPTILGTLGLLTFLYGIGIQYGKKFFIGITSMEGIKANIAAFIGVMIAGFISLSLYLFLNLEKEQALGIFAGAGTSTSTLQAILEVFKNDKATVGYSVAYPFGVAGPIIFIYFLKIWFNPNLSNSDLTRINTQPILLKNEKIIGITFGELLKIIPDGISIDTIRRGNRNQIPQNDMILKKHDLLLASTTNKNIFKKVVKKLGAIGDNDIITDRRDFDFIRVFVSKSNIIGSKISDLNMPEGIQYSISHIRRGEADIVTYNDFILEAGDRVGVFVDRKHIKEVRNFFGDSTNSLADLSYTSIGIGASLGLIVGLIQFPIPYIGKISLGLAGLLLTALYLGKKGRSGYLVWEMPMPSNLVFRNFGLTIFLAQVGLSSGNQFFTTVANTGIQSLIYGAIVLLVMFFVTFAICVWVFKLPFDFSVGIVAGATGNPAIFAFSNKLIPTEKTDLGYAMIFPSMTIAKILFVKIVALILLS